jgi:glycosyltransferase involved in cell wall biosynthesis
LIQNISNKRILFCSSFTPPVNAGGGKNAFNFAKFLSEKGLNVTLLTLNRRGKLPRREMAGSLKIVRILYFNYNLFTKLLSLFIILPGYLIYVIRNDIIFIYGGNIIAFEFIIFTGKLSGRHVVFRSTMLGEDDIGTLLSKGFPFKAIRKKILNMISTYFSINPEFTKSYLKVFNDDKKVIESPQGVNTKIFHPVSKEARLKLREKLDLPKDQFIIITVGYLLNRKGFTEIFENLVHLEIPFLYIIIGDFEVGKSHYLYHLTDQMKNLYNHGINSLKERILITGPKENINEYLQASDIFLLNSKREGVPNALLEAMACGILPVIKSIRGIDKFITFNRKNALVFNHPGEMGKLILEAYDNRSLINQLGWNDSNKINLSFEVVFKIIFANSGIE